MKKQGLVIELTEALMTGFLPKEKLLEKGFFFDEQKMIFCHKKRNLTYKGGVSVLIKIDKVDRWKQEVTLAPFL